MNRKTISISIYLLILFDSACDIIKQLCHVRFTRAWPKSAESFLINFNLIALNFTVILRYILELILNKHENKQSIIRMLDYETVSLAIATINR